MSAEVAPGLLGGFAVLACEYSYGVVGLGGVLYCQANSGTHLAGGATADGVHHHHRRSRLGKRPVDVGCGAGLCYASASQFLAHRNDHNLWIHLLSPLETKTWLRKLLLPNLVMQASRYQNRF